MDIISKTTKSSRAMFRKKLMRSVFVFTFLSPLLLVGCHGGSSSGKSVPTGTLSLLAGNTAGAGNFDGKGTAASFDWPEAITTTDDGIVYVADTLNNKIRKIMPDGTVTTLAGSGQAGSNDGVRGAASFNSPMGIAVGSNGTVYVVDTGNNTIRMVTSDGAVSTLAGTPGVEGDLDTGTGLPSAQAQFHYPIGVAVDANNTYLYVADTGNVEIRKVRISDGMVTTLAGNSATRGNVDGVGALAQFSYPWGMAVDAANNVYVSDSDNNSIRKIAPDGTVTTLAGSGVSGHDDGVGTAASFYGPRGLALFNDALYVVSGGDDLVRRVDVTDGSVTTWAGSATDTSGSEDGTRAQARFSRPEGVAVDASGTVYVADTQNHAIRKIVPNGSDILVSTLAGSAPKYGDDNGAGSEATFNRPEGLAVAADGTIYVADASNNQVRAITPAGVVSALAGSWKIPCIDGQGSDASFNVPTDVAVGADGFIYVADFYDQHVRKVTPEGNVTTLTDTSGGSFCFVPSVDLGSPRGIVVSVDATVYASSSNNTILKIVNGAVETLAGSAGTVGSVDGVGTAATFSSPSGIVIGADGNLYVADSGNSRIRKITPAGVVSTLAGSTSGYADGVGTVAKFNWPQGLAIDAAGNLFVADTNNNLIRKVTPAGRVTTVVGAVGKMGITLGKLPATLARPSDVAIDSVGRLLITSGNAILVAEKPGGF